MLHNAAPLGYVHGESAVLVPESDSRETTNVSPQEEVANNVQLEQRLSSLAAQLQLLSQTHGVSTDTLLEDLLMATTTATRETEDEDKTQHQNVENDDDTSSCEWISLKGVKPRHDVEWRASRTRHENNNRSKNCARQHSTTRTSTRGGSLSPSPSTTRVSPSSPSGSSSSSLWLTSIDEESVENGITPQTQSGQDVVVVGVEDHEGGKKTSPSPVQNSDFQQQQPCREPRHQHQQQQDVHSARIDIPTSFSQYFGRPANTNGPAGVDGVTNLHGVHNSTETSTTVIKVLPPPKFAGSPTTSSMKRRLSTSSPPAVVDGNNDWAAAAVDPPPSAEAKGPSQESATLRNHNIAVNMEQKDDDEEEDWDTLDSQHQQKTKRTNVRGGKDRKALLLERSNGTTTRYPLEVANLQAAVGTRRINRCRSAMVVFVFAIAAALWFLLAADAGRKR